jgi:hypothetical protein
MKKSRKPSRIGRASAAWASALLLIFTLGVTAPTVAFAQDGDTPAAEPATPAVDSPVTAPDTAPAVAPDPAPAADPIPAEVPDPAPAAQTSLEKLSAELMNILVPTFVSLIGALCALLLNWVRRRFKLNVSDQQIDAWQKLAEKAAARGAEWARNKAKGLAEGKTVPGPEVLEVAANWAIEMGKTFNLPEMGREKLEGLIEAHLSVKRADPSDPLPA